MPRADRIFALAQLLAGGRRWTIDEIAERLEVSPRTLYRDLADLERQVPIDREGGAYKLMAGAVLRPMNLTPRERLVLGAVLSSPAVAQHAAFRKDLSSVKLKIAAASGGESGSVSKVADRDRSGPLADEVVKELESAIAECRSLSILYTSLSSGKAEWRGIDPWGIVHRAEAWYLVGRCHRNREPRVFRMDRIGGVLAIGGRFERPKDFDLEKWLDPSWGIMTGDKQAESVIVFDRSVAPLIEFANHHPTESKRKLDRGAIEYRVRVGNLDELARWVVGFGGAARAIEPPDLVEAVRRITAGALAVHAPQRAAAYTRGSRKPAKPRRGERS